MTPFALLGLGLALLLVLVLLARPGLFAQMLYHLCEWVRIPFALLTTGFQAAQHACQTLFTTAVGHGSDEKHLLWPGFVVMTRLLYLVMCVCVFLSDFAIGRLRTVFVLFGANFPITSTGLPLDDASGLLWVAFVTLWGMNLLEFLEVIPVPARLFPEVKPGARKFLFAYSLVGFLTTLGVVGLLFYLADVEKDGGSWPDGSHLINALLGPLIGAALLLGTWGVVLGLGTLVGLGSGVLSLVFALLRWLFGSINDMLKHLGERLLPSIVAGVGISQNGHRGGAMQVHPADLTGQHPLLTGANMDKITSLVFVGTVGHRFGPTLVEHIEHLAVDTTTLCAVGIADISAFGERAEVRVPMRDGSVIDVSATLAEMQHAFSVSPTRKAAEVTLLHTVFGKMVNAHTPATGADGQILIVLGAESLHAVIAVVPELKARLERHIITLLVFLPEAYRQDEFLPSFQDLVRLRNEGTIAASILIDPQSPLAQYPAIGEDRQDVLVARCLAGYLVGHTHRFRSSVGNTWRKPNRRFAEIMTLLGNRSPFVGFATQVAGSVRGNPLRWYQLLRRMHKGPPRGYGDLNDLRAQAERATEALFTQTATTASPMPLTPTLAPPFMLSYLFPLKNTDARFEQLMASIRTWLLARFPGSQANFVAGVGTPLPHITEPYILQVGCLYGIGPESWMRHELAAPQDGDDLPPTEGEDV